MNHEERSYNTEDVQLVNREQNENYNLENKLWIERQVSEFDDVLRINYQKPIFDFCQIVIHKISEITQAFSGVIYIHQDEDSNYEAIASYACSLKQLPKKIYKPGEGVIGQVAVSKKMIHYDNLPPENTELKLSAVKINAVNIIILPLTFNDTVYGILELVYINYLETKYLDLLEKLGHNIAVMIESIQNNARTARLLLASQEQAELLRSQEEEMRQNLEELSATQEALQKRENELTGHLKAINKNLLVKELDMDGQITEVNDNLATLLKFELKDIIGQHHQVILGVEYYDSEDYQVFWENLRKGESNTGEFLRYDKFKKEHWFRASYTPILDRFGHPEKILMVGLDITEQKELSLDVEGQLYAISQSNLVAEFDMQGRIMKANEIYARTLGYEVEEVINKHHETFIVKHDRDKIEEYEMFWNMLRDGEFFVGDFERLKKSGEKVWVRGSYYPIRGLNGEPYKVVKIAQDISQQKKLEERVAKQLEELKTNEEELRKNLEELQSTQEALEKAKLEIEQKNKQLETDKSILTKSLAIQKEKEEENQKIMRQMQVNEEDMKKSEQRMRQVIKDFQLQSREIKEKDNLIETLKKEIDILKSQVR